MESERVRDQRLHDSIIEENLLRAAGTGTGYSSDFFGPAIETGRVVNESFDARRTRLWDFQGNLIAEHLLPFEVDETEEEFLARLEVIVARDNARLDSSTAPDDADYSNCAEDPYFGCGDPDCCGL